MACFLSLKPPTPSDSDKRLYSCTSTCKPQAFNVLPYFFAPTWPAWALSLEGVSQMDSILPRGSQHSSVQHLTSSCEGFESKTLRAACGCKIMTPRYACNLAPGCISSEPTFAGLRKNQKKRGFQKKGFPKKREKGFPLAKVDIA